MKLYSFEVTETLQGTISVTAENQEEARQKIKSAIENGDIIFSDHANYYLEIEPWKNGAEGSMNLDKYVKR